MPRYRLLLEYDGGGFHGWQVQPAVRTVQGELERALALILREPVRTAAAGRTDVGVHATGQVVSFDASRSLDCRRVIEGIHGICGGEIRVHRCEEAPPDFHARHRAIWREYLYRLADGPTAVWRSVAWQVPRVPPLPLLRVATDPLLGRHDFSAFANASSDNSGPTCRVIEARWECCEGGFLFTIRADRFLYKMVRTIVSTLVRESGSGGGGETGILRILSSGVRRNAAPPAPPQGLVLARVGYDPSWPGPEPGPVISAPGRIE
jgi:tRNA pseudouridine38-40 synthase